MDINFDSEIKISSALAEHPSSITSSKYQFFNTKILIDALLEKKWEVYSQAEAFTRNPLRKGFQRHMIIFKNKEYSNPEGDLQVVVRNAHDNTASVEIFTGFMRILCSNQLFARSLGTGSLLKIKHNDSNIQKKVLDGFYKMVEFLPVYDKIIHLLIKKKLSSAQMEEFTRRAIQYRFEEDPEKLERIPVESVWKPRRTFDNSNTAWIVLNRVQENLVRGGVSYSRINKNGKLEIATTRPLRSITRVPELNDFLLDTMLEVSGVA